MLLNMNGLGMWCLRGESLPPPQVFPDCVVHAKPAVFKFGGKLTVGQDGGLIPWPALVLKERFHGDEVVDPLGIASVISCDVEYPTGFEPGCD